MWNLIRKIIKKFRAIGESPDDNGSGLREDQIW